MSCTRMIEFRRFGATLAGTLLLALQPLYAAENGPSSDPGPIRTEEHLQAYLRQGLEPGSPLLALSPGARERFLNSLVFGRTGLGGFSTEDITRELTADQIRALMALFDLSNEPWLDSLLHEARPESDHSTAGLPAAPPASADPSAVEDRYTALRLALHTLGAQPAAAMKHQASALLEQHFPIEFTTAGLNATSDADLHWLFQAAYASASWGDPRAMAAQQAAWEELQRRGLTQPEHTAAMRSILLKLRAFDQARALGQADLAEGTAIPPVQMDTRYREGTPAIIRPSADGAQWRVEAISLAEGPRIIVVGDDACHFTADAVAELEADPGLTALFKSHGLWIAPQTGQADPSQFAEWNAAHSAFSLHPVYQESDWAFVRHWATPSFFFLLDGELQATVVGWPKQGRAAELRVALAKIGLLD